MRVAGAAAGGPKLSRILAYTSPMRGHLFPLVPVLEELRHRGHEVAIRTLGSEVGGLHALGLEAKPIAPRIEALAHEDWKARTPIGGGVRTTRVFCERAEIEVRDLGQAIEEESPDALLVDVLAWGALARAEARALPWASFSPLPLLTPSADVPPQGPGLKPARGALGRSRDRLLRPLFQASFDRLARSRLNAIRASLGLPRLDHAYDLYLRPPLLLMMSSDAFEYTRSDLPRSVVMIGPCTWDPPGQLPDRLAGINAPLVLVATSTDFQNDGRLVRTAFEALAAEAVHVVATMPAARANDLIAPANGSLLPFVPHGPILARASCAITHGGMGATQKALAHGVPVCAVPFGRDQFEVARRVAVSGAGTRLPAWRLNPSRLREKVREAMTMRSEAERVARSFAAAGGARAAADAFEGRLLDA